jgi:hypothetical protein
MRCSQVEKFLSAHLDGELEEPERHRIAEHLSVCPRCTERLAHLRATRSLLRRLGAPDPALPFDLDAVLQRPRTPLSPAARLELRARAWWEQVIGARARAVLCRLRPACLSRRPTRLAGLGTALAFTLLLAVVARHPQRPDAVSALVPARVSTEFAEDARYLVAPPVVLPQQEGIRFVLRETEPLPRPLEGAAPPGMPNSPMRILRVRGAGYADHFAEGSAVAGLRTRPLPVPGPAPVEFP